MYPRHDGAGSSAFDWFTTSCVLPGWPSLA
jgi:hypothetical protein